MLQTFNDHAIFRGSDLRHDLAEDNVELRLTLEILSLEEVTRIWDHYKEPYQLSICYTVQVVSIDSTTNRSKRPRF